MSHLLCVGHLNVEDTDYDGRPEVLKAPGGAALYSAVAARIWGIDVSILSRVGENYPPDYLSELQDAGIDISNIRHVAGPTMAGYTRYEKNGDRTYKMYSDVNRRLELTPMPEDIMSAKNWDINGIHVATMPPHVQRRWLLKFEAYPCFKSLDTDISFIQTDRAGFSDLLHFVDAVFPNHLEAQSFSPGASLDEAACEMMKLGPRIVVVKCGKDGARVYANGSPIPFLVPAVANDVVDVTGAGDSFAGGFIAGFLQHGDITRAAWMGAISSALSISDFGALHALRKISGPVFQSLREQYLPRS